MIASAGFGVVILSAIVSALFVVRSPNLVHAVLWLAITLLSTAALYAMLGASFLAGAQALLYVGGVSTLMIFGVMITRRHEGIVVAAEHSSELRGGLIAASLFAIIAVAVTRTPGLDEVPKEANDVTPAELGRAIFGPNLLSFETLSLLLLGAIIGAIVIARKRDPGVRSRGFAATASGTQAAP